ncbi:MAG: isoprenylcysteine carboxylmethyltransferase family protein [Halobaculum sp.]
MATPVYLRRPQLYVFVAVGLVLASRELFVRRYLDAGLSRTDDRRSFWILWTATAIGTTVALILPFSAVGNLPAPRGLFWLGIVVMLAGFAVRMVAVATLGELFRHRIVLLADHEVVERGPYGWVRHPAYSGAVLTYVGVGLACANWLSLVVVTAGALVGFGHRVRVEERVLRRELDGYEEYTERVPYRLVPFVW